MKELHELTKSLMAEKGIVLSSESENRIDIKEVFEALGRSEIEAIMADMTQVQVEKLKKLMSGQKNRSFTA